MYRPVERLDLSVEMTVDTTLDKNSSKPLYLQLEEILHLQIETGQLVSGDRIPSENELSEKHDISRMTARKAVESLVLEGLIYRRPGKGSFVSSPKFSYIPPTLFSFSELMSSLGFEVETEVLELKPIKPTEKDRVQLSLGRYETVISLKRRRFVNGEPLAYHASLFPTSKFSGVLDRRLTQRPLAKSMEEVSGLKISGTRDYAEASLAHADEAEILDIRIGAPVLLVYGIAFTETGVPVRSTKAIYRGDRFRFMLAGGSSAALEIKAPVDLKKNSSQKANWVGVDFVR